MKANLSMSEVRELRNDAERSSLQLLARYGKLVVRGSASTEITLVQRLLSHKQSLLMDLLQPTEAEWETWQERAAIAEYDGHLPRTEAETLAWAELQEARATAAC